MSGERLSKWEDRTVRCGNGHEFTVKQEWVGYGSGEEAGYSQGITWAEGNVEPIAECPVPGCHSDRFDLVDE